MSINVLYMDRIFQEAFNVLYTSIRSGDDNSMQITRYTPPQESQVSNLSSNSNLDNFVNNHISESSDSVKDLGAINYINQIKEPLEAHLNSTLVLEHPILSHLYSESLKFLIEDPFGFNLTNKNYLVGYSLYQKLCADDIVKSSANKIFNQYSNTKFDQLLESYSYLNNSNLYNSNLEESNLIVEIATKFLGPYINTPLKEVIRDITNLGVFDTLREFNSFVTTELGFNLITAFAGFYTFKKLVHLYVNLSFKGVDLTQPGELRLKQKQIFVYMLFFAAPFTLGMMHLSANHPLIKGNINVNIGTNSVDQTSAEKFLPFLSNNKLKKGKLKKLGFFLAIILLFMPHSMFKFIFSFLSFNFMFNLLIASYFCLVLYNVINYIFLILLSKNIINLTLMKDNSNYFVKKILSLEDLTNSNLELFIHVFKINIFIYTFCLLFFMVIFFLS